ncbi:MAG: RNA polymerase sigma factor RpoD/SigA [Chitinophagales bacterium]|nr:RNA polymerase sigma factor RpoD/SigA [Chitinophagales bacterium]
MRQLKINSRITNRDSYSIDRYLFDISKYPLLKEEEEVALTKRIKKGDQTALDDLVRANLRFVVSVAKQYQNQGLALNDLINEGNLGLIKAAARFDETKGFKFISYAVWWIRQSILHALVSQSRLIRLPLNRVAEINKLKKISEEFEQEHQREPSIYEIAESSSLSEVDIENIEKYNQPVISLNQTIHEDEDESLDSFIADESSESPDAKLVQEALKIQMKYTLNILTNRELEILEYCYGLNDKSKIYSMDEIGERLSLTRERVRQLRNKSIRKLRKTARKEDLKPYLG